MNGVLGMLELVEDANLHPGQKQQLEIARRSGQTLLALINDILDLSKIESGKLELEQQPFNLQDFLQDLQQLYGKQLKDKQLSFTLHIDPEIPVWIEGDRTRLWQILTNLVSNAIKFTHQGGITVALTIVTQADAEMLQIEVRDTGIGIPPEAQAKIFDSFSQADGSTTRKYGGTGLGLTIAQNLVKIMGGRITVTSEVGKGSAFAFAFPLRRAASQTAPVSESHGDQVAVSLSHLRVLVAEDNAVNRQVVQGMLRSLGVTLVELVEDGSHAVDLLQRQPFDVILMDVQMPVMDGYEATRRIRALADTAKAEIPIIALTASASIEERKRAHDEGMNDFLTKPMQRIALQDVLCRFAETPADTPVEPIRASAG
jgi:CheY-like chemotaxis protein